jgi:hypothetical protein
MPLWEHELKNAYVGQGIWKPWANTVGYRPFKEDIKDYSGNGNDWTVYSGSVSFSDNMVNISNRLSRADLIYANRNSFTLSVYTSVTQWEQYLYMSPENKYTSFSFWTLEDSSGRYFINQIWENNIWDGANVTIWDTNIHLLTSTRDWTTIKSYIDWVLAWSNTISVSIVSRPYMTLGNVANYSYTSKRWDLILENRARTAQEIADYYNTTKWNYGL